MQSSSAASSKRCPSLKAQTARATLVLAPFLFVDASNWDCLDPEVHNDLVSINAE
jgi:hypothetical protein